MTWGQRFDSGKSQLKAKTRRHLVRHMDGASNIKHPKGNVKRHADGGGSDRVPATTYQCSASRGVSGGGTGQSASIPIPAPLRLTSGLERGNRTGVGYPSSSKGSQRPQGAQRWIGPATSLPREPCFRQCPHMPANTPARPVPTCNAPTKTATNVGALSAYTEG